jgi:hypothetical protein
MRKSILITGVVAGGVIALSGVGGGAYALAHNTPTTTVIYKTSAPKTVPAATPTKTDPPKTTAPTTVAPAAAPATSAPPPVQTNNSPTIVVNIPPSGYTDYVPITSEVPVYVTDNQGVVQQFYADLNAQDFTDAWNLGGDNLNGNTGYDNWVAGYTTTTVPGGIQLSTWQYYPDSNAVEVTITAGQLDGSVNTYHGYYAVSGGVIVGANVVQTS